MIAARHFAPTCHGLKWSILGICPDDAPRFPCHAYPSNLQEATSGIAVFDGCEPPPPGATGEPRVAIRLRNAHGTMNLFTPAREAGPWQALTRGTPVEVAAVAQALSTGGYLWAPLAVAAVTPGDHPVCKEGRAPLMGSSGEALAVRWNHHRWGSLTADARNLLDLLLEVPQLWTDGRHETILTRLHRMPAPVDAYSPRAHGVLWRAVQITEQAISLGRVAITAGASVDGDALVLGALLLEVGRLDGDGKATVSADGLSARVPRAGITQLRQAASYLRSRALLGTERDVALLDHVLVIVGTYGDVSGAARGKLGSSLEARLVHHAADATAAVVATLIEQSVIIGPALSDADTEPNPALEPCAAGAWYARRRTRTTAQLDVAPASTSSVPPAPPTTVARLRTDSGVAPVDDDCPF